MRRCALAAVLAIASSPTGARAEPPAEPAATIEAESKRWEFSLNLTGYIVPDDRDYLQPTFTADYDTFHLEIRYNYEDLDTGSVWAGYNFSFGEDLTVDFTPMFGLVHGDTEAVAPGYGLTLGCGMFELYTEGEYLFDLEESSDNFFYTWTELSLAPIDWFRFGVVIQRTKAYDSDLDVDRGLLAGFTVDRFDFTAYLFNPGRDDATVALSVGVSF